MTTIHQNRSTADACGELVEAWRRFDDTKTTPFILDGDVAQLNKLNGRWQKLQSRNRGSRGQLPDSVFCHLNDWEAYQGSKNFGKGNDPRLHTGLLPMPYTGNLSEAKIFVFMLNPGAGPPDYYGEYEVDDYRQALLANLRQDPLPNGFLFLDPQFSWHWGYRYWNKKLRALIEGLSIELGVSYDRARCTFQRYFASVEPVPYHAEQFKIPKGTYLELQSFKLAMAFLEELCERSATGECLVIVTRKAKRLLSSKHQNCPNVIGYSGGAARGASMSPKKSKGGRAIVDFFKTHQLV